MTSKEIIESSYSSSSHMMRAYDAFVSFRGFDVRNNFADHLFGALHRKSIHFFEDEKLKKGKKILPELIQAIEGSHILIVIFSKKYASSKWCLRELVKIAGYIDHSAKHVLPIFYDVDPSEVRNQSGNYEKAFGKHEERYKDDKAKMEEVQRWREALTQVANLAGWHISDKPQDSQIREIVQDIIKRLHQNFPSLPNEDLVAMEFRVKELEELLLLDSNDVVRVVGICGMPGIGKTTLARALYGRIYHRYDLHCFMDDVRKSFLNSGTLGAQRQLLCQVLNEKDLELHNVYAGTHSVTTRLRHARVLIVLDNVDQIDQLKELALNRTCLAVGSRIIIISTNEHVLRTYGVDNVYQVEPLNYNNAVQLFCRNAFKDNYIRDHYKELTRDVLSYAGGHPLAIKVLGSSLFGRDVSHWRSALARLRVIPNKNIMDVFLLSFDGLDEMEKEIFLDIACFLMKEPEHYVKEVLEFRGFYPEIGLRVLVEKSLITIEYGDVMMHALLVDLGRHIVKEKSPKEPRKWSRLWDVQDLQKVMLDDMAPKNLEAIVVRNRILNTSQETTIRVDNLSEMSNLKLLILKVFFGNYIGNLNHLSNELGYLTWEHYPFDCLPPSFQPDKLVELSLKCSRIKKLWEGRKPLHNLRRLDLSSCDCLIEMPDVGEAPNLEDLNLEYCIELRKIDKSIGLLRKLTVLNLEGCINLVSIPNNIFNVHSLEYVNLSGCSKRFNNQSLDERRDGEHLKKLCIDEAPIHSISTASIFERIKSYFPFRFVHSRTKKDSVICLLPSLPCFPCLRELDLSFCNVIKIPNAIGNLYYLESLNLKGNKFHTLPSLKELSKLFYLNLQQCTKLKYLSKLPSRTDLSQIERREGGFIMYNCPDLVEREDCNDMGLSWMMQLVQAAHQAQLYDEIESIIPGSEIPRWFNNQHVGTGSLLSIKAPPKDNNCIGIVCCVAFKMETNFERSFPLGKRISMAFPIYLDADLTKDKSDHIWLFYIPEERLTRGIFGDEEIEIEIRIYNIRKKIEVKTYGYRWVYDREQYNLASSRKRKFLAIQENT